MDYEYIANQLLLLYQGGRPTVEGLDVREIIPWVKEAHAAVGRSQFYENYKADNQHTVSGQWLVSYDFPILRDASGNIRNIDPTTGYVFVELLEDYLQLPKNRGIVRVAIRDPLYKGNRNLSYIQFENYENLRGGQTMQFAGRFMYSVNNKKIFILPTGMNNATINFNTVVVTTAVANDTTMNDGMVMLIVQQLLPIMNQRFGRKPDMVTDFNPNAS